MAGLPLPDPSQWGNFLPGIEVRNKRLQHEQNLAQKQFDITGIAKEVQSLDRLKNMLPGGEDHPIYKQAKDAFDRQQRHTEETIKSSQFYRENPWRLYDPTTKSIQAEKMAARGQFPEGTPAYTPEQSQQVVNNYEKERFNKGTPQFLQQQYESIGQIDETLKLIDPEKAFPYSGVAGQVELWKDRYEAQNTGKPSQKLLDYEANETYLHDLRMEIRNFWGDSITRSAREDLDYLVNPSNWMNHPDVAKRKYKAVIDAYQRQKAITVQAVEHGKHENPEPLFPVKGKKSPDEQQGNGEKFQTLASEIGLNPSENLSNEAVTEENIRLTAKQKNWSHEKLQAALEHWGFV